MNEEKETIVCLFPGEVFSSVWVSHWTGLLCHLLSRFNVEVLFGYCSSVHITRASLVDAFLKLEEKGKRIDFALWLDDDNVLTVEQFDLLYRDLKEWDYLDGIVGWTWCQPNEMQVNPVVSCGLLKGTEAKAFGPFVMADLETNVPVWGIDYSGFPAALIKWKVHRRLGRNAFKPIESDNYWEIVGEDVSFFVRAKKAGFYFAVDRRVKVPHLKLRNADFSLETLRKFKEEKEKTESREYELTNV